MTAANNHRFTGEHITDALQGFFRVTFLNMTDQRIDHRHAEDNQGIDPVPHHRRKQRRSQQDVD